MMPIAINGRFLTQGMTGVQRFAREITAAADRLAGNDAWPKANLFMPSSVAQSPFARRVFAWAWGTPWARKALGLEGQHLR